MRLIYCKDVLLICFRFCFFWHRESLDRTEEIERATRARAAAQALVQVGRRAA